jgi:hypothetical protein
MPGPLAAALPLAGGLAALSPEAVAALAVLMGLPSGLVGLLADRRARERAAEQLAPLWPWLSKYTLAGRAATAWWGPDVAEREAPPIAGLEFIPWMEFVVSPTGDGQKGPGDEPQGPKVPAGIIAGLLAGAGLAAGTEGQTGEYPYTIQSQLPVLWLLRAADRAKGIPEEMARIAREQRRRYLELTRDFQLGPATVTRPSPSTLGTPAAPSVTPAASMPTPPAAPLPTPVSRLGLPGTQAERGEDLVLPTPPPAAAPQQVVPAPTQAAAQPGQVVTEPTVELAWPVEEAAAGEAPYLRHFSDAGVQRIRLLLSQAGPEETGVEATPPRPPERPRPAEVEPEIAARQPAAPLPQAYPGEAEPQTGAPQRLLPAPPPWQEPPAPRFLERTYPGEAEPEVMVARTAPADVRRVVDVVLDALGRAHLPPQPLEVPLPERERLNLPAPPPWEEPRPLRFAAPPERAPEPEIVQPQRQLGLPEVPPWEEPRPLQLPPPEERQPEPAPAPPSPQDTRELAEFVLDALRAIPARPLEVPLPEAERPRLPPVPAWEEPPPLRFTLPAERAPEPVVVEPAPQEAAQTVPAEPLEVPLPERQGLGLPPMPQWEEPRPLRFSPPAERAPEPVIAEPNPQDTRQIVELALDVLTNLPTYEPGPLEVPLPEQERLGLPRLPRWEPLPRAPWTRPEVRAPEPELPGPTPADTRRLADIVVDALSQMRSPVPEEPPIAPHRERLPLRPLPWEEPLPEPTFTQRVAPQPRTEEEIAREVEDIVQRIRARTGAEETRPAEPTRRVAAPPAELIIEGLSKVQPPPRQEPRVAPELPGPEVSTVRTRPSPAEAKPEVGAEPVAPWGAPGEAEAETIATPRVLPQQYPGEAEPQVKLIRPPRVAPEQQPAPPAEPAPERPPRVLPQEYPGEVEPEVGLTRPARGAPEQQPPPPAQPPPAEPPPPAAREGEAKPPAPESGPKAPENKERPFFWFPDRALEPPRGEQVAQPVKRQQEPQSREAARAQASPAAVQPEAPVYRGPDYTGWSDAQWREVTRGLGAEVGKEEGEAWIARFYMEHGAFPWQVGPFDPQGNLFDHIIAWKQSEQQVQNPRWTKVGTEGNVYARPAVVPEFWPAAYYSRYQGPTSLPSGQQGPWQASLNLGQLPPPGGPVAYVAGMEERGQPYYVPRPYHAGVPGTTENVPPPSAWQVSERLKEAWSTGWWR